MAGFLSCNICPTIGNGALTGNRKVQSSAICCPARLHSEAEVLCRTEFRGCSQSVTGLDRVGRGGSLQEPLGTGVLDNHQLSILL